MNNTSHNFILIVTQFRSVDRELAPVRTQHSAILNEDFPVTPGWFRHGVFKLSPGRPPLPILSRAMPKTIHLIQFNCWLIFVLRNDDSESSTTKRKGSSPTTTFNTLHDTRKSTESVEHKSWLKLKNFTIRTIQSKVFSVNVLSIYWRQPRLKILLTIFIIFTQNTA